MVYLFIFFFSFYMRYCFIFCYIFKGLILILHYINTHTRTFKHLKIHWISCTDTNCFDTANLTQM